MARIRSVHPALFTDEGFMSLSAEAAVFMIGLWCECDDAGHFEWKPLTLKARLRPASTTEASALLSEIEAAGFITKYVVSGRTYGEVRNFTKYQRPKFPKYVHPNPDNSGSATEALPQISPTPTPKPPQMEDGDGVGGDKPQATPSVRESASPSAPATAPSKAKGSRLPSDWALPDDWRQWATDELLSSGSSLPAALDWIPRAADRFRDHWCAKAGRDGAKLDWEATWRNWIRRDIENGKTPRGGANGKTDAAGSGSSPDYVARVLERQRARFGPGSAGGPGADAGAVLPAAPGGQ